MRKVFNISYIAKTLEEFPYCSLKVSDVTTHIAFKKLNDFYKSKHRIDNLNNLLSPDKFNEVAKRFFPSKFESLQNSDWNTIAFCYDDDDEKVHWVVNQNGNARHFKVKTEEIFSRTDEEIKLLYKEAKKILDKFYGYWVETTDDGWFITDMNKTNGEWRVLADKNHNYCGSFGDFTSINDLVIV